MNFAHLHLLLNHFPVIGTIIGLAFFVVSLFEKSDGLMRRASLIVFAAIALLTIPTFCSGVGAQQMIKAEPGVSVALVQRHEGAAMLALWFMEATGALALIGLWQSYRRSRPARWNATAVLLFSIVTVGLMARTGNTGGDIRHPEVRSSQETTGAEGAVGSLVRVFEPTPDKFTSAMLFSKWWWAFIMDLHFIGLALLIGTIGVLDLRIMGFAKQMPIAPLHRLVPWAMAGFGINLVTGMLAFIGMPVYYTYDVAFWLKMFALLLLGLNAGAFYLTGIFHQVEHLGPGEDAPMAAKLLAASSLFLWLAVIAFGRYIQPLENSLSSGFN